MEIINIPAMPLNDGHLAGFILNKKKMHKIGIDKRGYIHPKEMDFISYLLNSKDEFNESQVEWYKSKVITRLKILQPLVNEITLKGYSFDVVSSDLNNEYNDLIFLRNKHCLKKDV